MGNEGSVDRGRYDDDETLDGTYDGTSVFSGVSRQTDISGVSGNTGMSSRIYGRSSKRSERAGTGAIGGAILNSGLMDAICGNNFFEDDEEEDDYDGSGRKSGRSSSSRKSKSGRKPRKDSRDSTSRDESYDSGGSHSYDSPEEDVGRRSSRSSKKKTKEKKTKFSRSDDSYMSEDLDSKLDNTASKSISKESTDKGIKEKEDNSFESTGSNPHAAKAALAKPLASSFAKRCYFTKAGIGKSMQHYEGITLTGNTILMLASAMKLKGCPTICDEDLRRVEQTFPNQFSRLPDELLLSSGWRRISKYCNFSGKPIPDGVPFFHSRERCHPTGGYYFLLAASIGMERPSDVEPLSLDMLILLQTDFPTQCDQTPNHLIEDPSQWTLVTRFCFFSGGPINNEEDVYYQADFNGNPIYMLAFLSPNMTPEELYRLNDITGENALKSVAAVEEVETVYDLTDRDFDDLKLYHLGPCRALPEHLLNPSAWEKVLPQRFLECRENALARAFEFEVHAQEAVAKAEMASKSHSREMSYESIAENQQPSYDKNYQEVAPNAAVHTQENGEPVQPHLVDNQYSGAHSSAQGSYVEMHQIGNNEGQPGSSYRSSGDEGTFGMRQYDESHTSSHSRKETGTPSDQAQTSEASNIGSQPHYNMDTGYAGEHQPSSLVGFHHSQSRSGSAPASDQVPVLDHTVEGSFHHSQSRNASAASSDQSQKPDPSIASFRNSHSRNSSAASSDQIQKPDPSVGVFRSPQSRNSSAASSDQIQKPDPSVGVFRSSQSRNSSAASSDQQKPDPSQGSQVSSTYNDTSVDMESRAEDGTYGDNTINFEDPTVENNDDDPAVNDAMGQRDDPTVGDATTAYGDDPTLAAFTDAAVDYDNEPSVGGGDDPTVGGTTHAEDPTVAGIVTHAEDPTVAAINSDDRALHDYYKGIERQQYEEEHPDDELPPQNSRASSKASSRNAKLDFEFFQQEMQRVSIEENPFISPQHSRPTTDDNSDSYEIYEEMSSAPQESEYVSMQELDNNVSYHQEEIMEQIKEEEKKPSKSNYRDDPPSLPTTPKKMEPPEEHTRITNHAGYGFAKQFSSTPRSTISKSPKYNIVPQSKPTSPKFSNIYPKPVPKVKNEEKSTQEQYDDPSIEDLVNYEPASTFSLDEDNDKTDVMSPQSNIASPQSRGSKSGVSPESFSQGSTSSAMRGARELLKKNRQERLALMSKRRGIQQKIPTTTKSPNEDVEVVGNENKEPVKEKTFYSHARSRSVTPNKKRFQSTSSPVASPVASPVKKALSPSKKALSPTSPSNAPVIPKTPPPVSHRKTVVKNADFGSPKSDISGASSAWTEEPDGDKDSRRALILKMAKNRMRTKKEMKSSRNH